MPIDRDRWNNRSFILQNQPSWECPVCHLGHLEIKQDDLREGPDAGTYRNRSHPEWEPEMWHGVFTAIAHCSNKHCGQAVSISGKVTTERDIDDRAQEENIYSVYQPLWFNPPIWLFSIPKECPREILAELEAAFSLYFSDLPSATNHMRKCVELIMNRFKIPRFHKKGNRRPLMLGQRIKRFRDKYPSLATLAEQLDAVKWLGNEGSHGDNLTEEDLFDAFDLLEDYIIQHCQKHGKHLSAITKSINRRKKPRSHRR